MTDAELYSFLERFLHHYGRPILVADLVAALRDVAAEMATLDDVESILDVWANEGAP